MLIVLRVALIFLLVAVLAGGIAMLGNQLGRKIGRKKMTVFGLRPRHTSIFITTMTGSVIACTTLALAMIFSQDVAEAVKGTSVRLDELRIREKQLLERIDQLYNEVRRGTIIWNYGERIALTTIPADSDRAKVERSISEMIVQSNVLSVTKNNRVAVLQGAPQFDLDRVMIKYEPQDFQGWLETYTMQPKPVGLWLEVTENCMFRDVVPVTVRSFPVSPIFTQGQDVYVKEINPKRFLKDWYEFIEELRATALKKGMIELNDSLGGGVTADRLVQISQKVMDSSEAGGRVRLKAVANRELYQSSNLDVSIEVESL